MPVLKTELLDHVNVKVSDMHASMDFYTGFLGLEVASVSRDEQGEPDFVGLAAGPQIVYLSRNREFRSPANVPDRGLNHICVVVEPMELDDLLQKLRDESIPVRVEAAHRRDERGASVSTYVEDPDGHGVEIKQYPG